MKKLLILLVVFLLSACSYDISLQELKENYPKAVKEKVEKLPKDVQQNLTIPNQLPFEPTYANFSYETTNPADKSGEVFRTEFLFSNNEANLHVVHWHTEMQAHKEETEKAIDINGVETVIKNDENRVKQLEWKSDDGSTITLSMIITKQAEGKYSLDDLVNAAESMHK
ncbi:hypothetical protein MUO14_19370 [Halobacillus shinanisalinarum]|uniref:DUF4367 domain-containing protein n=1 Tax=Halobacillus shinanisalinarum TaxID=2932258 RepID=A0ABY4GWZ5_9BACI|nr:hypothetical protein [Halobacillus shinanisalinarum]UOQ92584.1 hypothetical protein MUO14_19370 [Halobacillus shinanisalinarum]